MCQRTLFHGVKTISIHDLLSETSVTLDSSLELTRRISDPTTHYELGGLVVKGVTLYS